MTGRQKGYAADCKFAMSRLESVSGLQSVEDFMIDPEEFDYDDEVTPEDIERLKAHVLETFGPIDEQDFVIIDGPAW